MFSEGAETCILKYAQGGPESDFKYVLSEGKYKPSEFTHAVNTPGNIEEADQQELKSGSNQGNEVGLNSNNEGLNSNDMGT